MELLVLSLLNGISFGVILFLCASGLSLVLGLMRIVNLAHGALYMVGAYIGWSLAVELELNFGLAVLTAGLGAALLGLVMERGFLCRLHGQLDAQVLITVGFVYIMMNSVLWIWGAMPHAPFTAPYLSGSFDLMGWTYPVARIVIIFIGLILAAGLWLLQDKTRVGAIVRAGMDDKEMTMGLGINLGLVLMAVFLLGAFLAGLSGIIGAQLLGVNNELAWTVLIWALAVVVVGGMGSVQGTLLGAIIIGLIDAFGKALFPVLGMFLVYLAMIIILLIRPAGLLGRKL